MSIWRVLDLLYPPTCCGCGVVGFELCPKCFKAIETLYNIHTCRICSLPITDSDHCSFCNDNVVFFSKLISWGIYRGVLRNLILRMKYGRGFGLIEYILGPVVGFITHAEIRFDLVIPVPLGRIRSRTRGYNQTILFGKPIAQALKKQLAVDALFRTRETRPQVGLNIDERKTNLRGAFKAQKELVQGKSVLLIDDVATTCSTLNECSKELISAGASEVFCFTLARSINQ